MSFRIILLSISLMLQSGYATAQTLERQLLTESPSELALAAAGSGDAARGAIVFHQPYFACTQCHDAGHSGYPGRSGDDKSMLGPDLANLEIKPNDEAIVESLLRPSNVIHEKYRIVSVLTEAGSVYRGIIASKDDSKVTLFDTSNPPQTIAIPQEDIEQILVSDVSLMPAGQVNQLSGRQQFLDLVKYLIEIRDGGNRAAMKLQPPAHLLVAAPIPEYEQTIDHAGLIEELNEDAFARGEAIYEQLCVNCHGTKETPGSLPTSLRFAEGKFKNGYDPYAMYQTLTRGFGMMLPQTWMVPAQKYDVIHYIRGEFLEVDNPSQYIETDASYLASLPKGDSRGPDPVVAEPWVNMNYGPTMNNTFETGNDATNFAYKGIASRLDSGPGGISRGNAWMIFDHDTMRVTAAWTKPTAQRGDTSAPPFINWKGIHFNGQHNIHPRISGNIQVANPNGPGWANPISGSFDDPRLVGRDGRKYGPLPNDWARLNGIYAFGRHSIIDYEIGSTNIVESSNLLTSDDAIIQGDSPTIARLFNIGKRENELTLQVATLPEDMRLEKVGAAVLLTNASHLFAAGVSAHDQLLEWTVRDSNRLCLTIPPGEDQLRFVLWTRSCESPETSIENLLSVKLRDPQPELSRWTAGGPPRWPEKVTTIVERGEAEGPFAVDVLSIPESNPWLARVRLTGFDFYNDGDRMAVCSWDGDVWLVSGLSAIDSGENQITELSWQRIASGLFQPLGLKIVDDRIYVSCRDQICILNDLNGDNETDFYECFNRDHQVTDHFHEFAMGLQTDEEGNFYYAKSARHALTAVVPHHGTLLKVSKDGSRTEIIAKGFRAANGVCLNPDGSFIVTDQEGHWNPKNRINWVEPGGFYGNMFGYHDVTDSSDDAMEKPLCWITNSFDRSPAELLWVDSEKWGPLNGSLLNLSYGYGKVYVVPFEDVNGQKQGGMCELPIDQFPTGTMRGRFNRFDGQLYLCGMFAWAGNQEQDGGLYRLRYTQQPVHLPVGLRATTAGIELEFSGTVDRASAENLDNYNIETWSLRRTENYGSNHYDERTLNVRSVTLSPDGKTVLLEIPDISPTWCMEIKYQINDSDGHPINGTIHNTIHNLR